MILLAISLVLLLIAGTARLAWTRLDSLEKTAFQNALLENSRTLLALSIIVLTPTILFISTVDWLPRWAILSITLLLWALITVIYWDRKVVPVSALTPDPATQILPGVTPLPMEELTVLLDGDVIKNFRWLFTPRNGLPVEMRLEVAVSTERYQNARAEPRRSAGDWAHYAIIDMPELDALAMNFHHLHLGHQWSTLEQASNLLNFTQACIQYQLDKDTTPAAEWPRYPIETLMDECGDCEDDVILAAAILKRLGFEVALLYYPGHCAIGLAGADGLPGEYVIDPHTRLKYFYGETTAEGWLLGEVPETYRGEKPDQIERIHRIVNG